MNKYLPEGKKILSLFLALVIFVSSNLPLFAQLGNFSGSLKSKVSGSVGEFYLNLSGYQSPFASIILTSDGVFIRATVADQFGNFSISEVLIKRGFSHFCLYAVDFKRIGESETCFTIPPAESSVKMDDIFLPPTIGLSRSEIYEGSSATAFGYTMPNALVTLYLSNGEKLTTTADTTGYYQFIIKNLKAGKYTLYTKAKYKGKESKAPTKQLQLRSLSRSEQFLESLKDLWKKILVFLSSLSLGPLWIVIPIIILIIIFILKLWPEKFTFIYQSKVIIFFTHLFRKPKHPLHHKWWVGY